VPGLLKKSKRNASPGGGTYKLLNGRRTGEKKKDREERHAWTAKGVKAKLPNRRKRITERGPGREQVNEFVNVGEKRKEKRLRDRLEKDGTWEGGGQRESIGGDLRKRYFGRDEDVQASTFFVSLI